MKIEFQTFANDKIKFYNSDWFRHFRRIPAGSVDLILTSPPFAILEKCEWDTELNLWKTENSFDVVLKKTGLLVWFCNLALMRKTLDSFTKFKLRSFHVTVKPLAQPISEKMPLPNVEFAIVFKKCGVKTGDTTWHPKKMFPVGKPYSKHSNCLTSPTRRHVKSKVSLNATGERWATVSIPSIPKCQLPVMERSLHPVQLSESYPLRPLIRCYSNSGDTVLDCFAGSGSTLVSAYRENRKAIGFEISPEYYREAISRIQMATCQMHLFNDFQHSQEVAA